MAAVEARAWPDERGAGGAREVYEGGQGGWGLEGEAVEHFDFEEAVEAAGPTAVEVEAGGLLANEFTDNHVILGGASPHLFLHGQSTFASMEAVRGPPPHYKEGGGGSTLLLHRAFCDADCVVDLAAARARVFMGDDTTLGADDAGDAHWTERVCVTAVNTTVPWAKYGTLAARFAALQGTRHHRMAIIQG
eukprot:g5587.t1